MNELARSLSQVNKAVDEKVSTTIIRLLLHFLITGVSSSITLSFISQDHVVLFLGHLHFTGTELKSSYLMMGVTSGHSDGHVTLV